MTKPYVITATSPLSSDPIERTATTAIEAETHLHALTRLCGRNARIEMWGPTGKPMTDERLKTLATAERSNLET